MAKLTYEDLLMLPKLTEVKENNNWCVYKDQQYFYKIVQEHNSWIFDELSANLEFMMQKENQIQGVNPVADIYYLENQFIAYRTPIAKGIAINDLDDKFKNSFSNWRPFIENLIRILNEATKKGYIFPDLFTNGNILIAENQELTLIDNDGMQIQNRWPGYFDYLTEGLVYGMYSYSNHNKYYNEEKQYFTSQFPALSFYTWFFAYFFRINLIGYLENQDYHGFIKALKKIHFPINSSCKEQCMNFFSLEQDATLKSSDFIQIIENYELKTIESKRVLVPR